MIEQKRKPSQAATTNKKQKNQKKYKGEQENKKNTKIPQKS